MSEKGFPILNFFYMSSFTELGLSQPLIDAVTEMGFETPTPIQEQAIPQLLEDCFDLIGLAQTGTGKTAAFGLPLLDLIDLQERNTQALILAPTRELCLQITREVESFGKHLKGLRICAVYGGADIGRQIKTLQRGVHLIVATPGRLRDLINRRAVNIRDISYVVLDEADEMLNMGFKEELDDILSGTPDDKLTWLFSATMPPEVHRISKEYMTNPIELSAGERNSTNLDIDHQFVVTRPRERYEVLRRYLDADQDTFGLVFTRTRRDAKEVAEQLIKDGYRADALHGDLNQAQRDRVMDGFRRGRIRILVATDVAARGIDVQDITHVFHYNIPDDLAFYTHRSGRTGRAGSKGISLLLMHPSDRGLLRTLERRLKIRFSEAAVPTGEQILTSRLQSYFNNIKTTPIHKDMEKMLPAISGELEEMDATEFVQRLLSHAFRSEFQMYLNQPDFRVGGGGQRRERERDLRSKRLFINIGSMDVDGKGGLLSLICDITRISGNSIGRIDMSRTHSFFDVTEDLAKKVVDKLDGVDMEGRMLRVNEDKPLRKNKKEFKKKKKFGKKKSW